VGAWSRTRASSSGSSTTRRWPSAIRDGADAVEAEIAREALDVLAGVRRELRVYVGLQRVYEPPIVPVALAHFDQRLGHAVLGAVVAAPFRMSDVVDDPSDREQVARFVDDDLTPRYRAWVQEAAALR
jgi:hypothetical protein